MNRSTIFQRLAMISVVALIGLAACRAPFQVRVTNFWGGERPYCYEDEALKMYVHWDKENGDRDVFCEVLDTFTGETEWKDLATVPIVENGSLETISFDPPLPQDGQFGLTAGVYEWVCDLNKFARSGGLFRNRSPLAAVTIRQRVVSASDGSVSALYGAVCSFFFASGDAAGPAPRRTPRWTHQARAFDMPSSRQMRFSSMSASSRHSSRGIASFLIS
jgi:hypothetical protein